MIIAALPEATADSSAAPAIERLKDFPESVDTPLYGLIHNEKNSIILPTLAKLAIHLLSEATARADDRTILAPSTP